MTIGGVLFLFLGIVLWITLAFIYTRYRGMPCPNCVKGELEWNENYQMYECVKCYWNTRKGSSE